MSTPESPSDLNPGQRKAQRAVLDGMLQAGQAVTVAKFGVLASAILGYRVAEQLGPQLLAELGFAPGAESEPQLGAGGALDVVPVWAPARRAKPMSGTERAQALSSRLTELSEAFVAEVLADPALAEATLATKATEMSRVFALELSRAVSARAKVNARTILDDCAMISNLAFKGA